LILNENLRGKKDCDNRSKGVLDFCQIHGIITNDSLCDAIMIKWGPCSNGAKLILRSSVPKRNH
jgi:Holliday junction resolvase RusA-like endonuclease